MWSVFNRIHSAYFRDNLESNYHKPSVKSFLSNENGGMYAGAVLVLKFGCSLYNQNQDFTTGLGL